MRGGGVMLRLKNVNAFYGMSQVLFDVSLEVGAGECVCLLGRNGAGKTTTLRSVMGLVTTSGEVTFNGENLRNLPPYVIAQRGVGYVPEDRRVFASLSVRENLEVARTVGARRAANGAGWTVEKVFELFPSLHLRQKVPAANLSGGEQQMLSIARTLMTNPDILLLDEPSEGLAPVVVDMLSERIAVLKETGLSILLSEQNLSFVAKLGDRAYVIDKGGVVYHGSMDELMADAEVQQRYLAV